MIPTSGPRKPSPHIRGNGTYWGSLRDFNGVEQWSEEGIRERYFRYADATSLASPTELVSHRTTNGEVTWVYPLMDSIISLIELNDCAAIEIGVEFIEEDDYFVFGMILKSNTARALRKAQLSREQEERIRQRIVSMMLAGNVPREFKEYRKLLKQVGVKHLWPRLSAEVDRANPYVMRHLTYLEAYGRDKTP